jgi:hypothetical protein
VLQLQVKAVPRFLYEGGEVEGFGKELKLAGFNLGQIQHIVDQLQQVATAGGDVPQKCLMLGRVRAGLQADQCQCAA